MKAKLILTVSLLSGMIFLGQAWAQETAKVNPFSNHWLLDEKDEDKRTRKLEKYLRGFDQPMLEVGQRYSSIHQALKDNNFELASYHWKKIRQTIKNGLMKRPARKKNAELILFNNTWQQVFNDFQSHDISRAWQGFDKATSACLSCHAAEKVNFVNNQPLFRLNH
ncbi:hypothetical protein SG34_004260 [Thalassomonas viridans]|uniref:Cytochrome C n=1 Tax=Thalassomonas viridans TaxID=137584 RepID=A0AAE9Z6T4_9GAMM|nr:hypothetical protein [Thalassomonas viridans]WDE06152.1 hypothetical protein SG34_004260 [Thalassomonas viridans]